LKKLLNIAILTQIKKLSLYGQQGIFAGIYFEDLKKFSNVFNKSFSKKHLLIFGINTEDIFSNEFYNSLIVTNNNLEILYKYNKKKLVPFGEFIPFNDLSEKFGLKKITQRLWFFF
jgi:Apolipoprotein N-acyltransferase